MRAERHSSPRLFKLRDQLLLTGTQAVLTFNCLGSSSMSIRSRILLLVAASLIALLAVGLLSLYQARKAEQDVRFVTETVVPSAIRSVTLLTKLKEVQIAALGMVAAMDEATTRQAYEEVTRRRESLQKAVDELGAQSDSQAQRGLIEVIKENLQNYYKSLDDTAKFALGGQRELAQATMAATVDQYLREQGEALATLDVEKTRSKDEAIASLNSGLSATLMLLTVVTLSALGLLGVIGVVLYRRIVAPIGHMQASMTRIATTQDFSHRIDVKRDDELGRSMKAFNLMIEKIEEGAAQVRRRTADIHAMLDNIPQGILTIEAGGRVHPEVSKHLATVLERDDCPGQPIMTLLFADSNLSADALSQADAAIGACIGEDVMNFEFNEHLLPREIEKTLPDGRVKVLDLSWAPMTNEQDVVDRMLVTVRDVTELRALARAAEAQRRELVLIGEILAVHQEKFDAFCVDATRLLDENIRVLAEMGNADTSARATAVHLLFRNMHTIKGNARTHGLMLLANTAHQAEETYERLRAGQVDWDSVLLRRQLDDVRSCLSQYRDLNEGKLGRRGPGRRGDVEKFALVPREQLKAWQDLLAVNETQRDAAWQPLRESMAAVGTETLAEALAPVLASLPALAEQLGKEAPEVRVDDHGIRLQSQISGTLRNVFVHLCRNAVDHGLEAALERIAANKRAKGLIQIAMDRAEGRLRIRLSDDGRGLALQRIRQRAIERGVLTADAQTSAAELAELVFAPGFSTAEQVSDVSGRGVGMDAVRAFLHAEGGDIRIEIHSHDSPSDSHVPFVTVITLPDRFGLAGASAMGEEVAGHA